MKLSGKRALVTGASRGLGHVIARRLLEDGAHVLLAAREEQALARAASDLQPLCRDDQRVAWRAGDVGRPDDVAALFEAARQEMGGVDVLVCNAGVYGPFGPIEDVPWDEWVAAMETNLYGVVLCCRAAVPHMKQQGWGKIIALSGGGATQPLPRISAYAASKAAVVRFAETLAEEVRGTGIDVSSIAPGALNTRLLDRVLDAGPERVGQSFYDRSIRQRDEGGASLETAADLVAFLASHESDGITGRLLSAPWDDWKHLPNNLERLDRSDVFTLRRIVPADRGWDEA